MTLLGRGRGLTLASPVVTLRPLDWCHVHGRGCEASVGRIFEAIGVSAQEVASITLLSVIMPVHEGLDDLMRQFEALRQHPPFGSWELIVVDDASSPSVEQVTHQAAEAGLPIRFRRLELRSGPGVARNVGMFVAEGKYLAFADVDDELSITSLLEVAQAAEAANVPVLACNYELATAQNASQAFPPAKTPLALSRESWLDRLGEYPAIWSWIFSRQLLETNAVVFPQLSYAEDLVFLVGVSRLSQGFSKADAVTYRHCLHGPGPNNPSASSIAKAKGELPHVLDRLRLEQRSCRSWQRSAIIAWRLRITCRFLLSSDQVGGSTRRVCVTEALRIILSHPVVSTSVMTKALLRKIQLLQVKGA